MKFLLCILMLSLSLSTSFGQVKLHSSYTQYWPTLFTTDFDEIDREIWIENDKITIITKFSGAKEIEILRVESFENKENRMIFNCTSRNGSPKSTLINPNPTRASVLDIYQVSPKSGEEEQIRFHLDYSEKPQQIPAPFKSI